VAIPGATIAADPAVSPDQRVIVFTTRAANNTQQLDVVTRVSANAPFGVPAILSIDLPNVNDGDADLSADGCSVLFASDRPGGAGNKDLWIADVMP
jgi:hypothetical protein